MHLFLSILVILYAALGAAAHPWPTDYRSLQFAHLTAQAAEWDCGPASAASLLILLGRQPTSGIALDKTEGISLYTLQKILEHSGVDSFGYTISWPQLEAYFSDPEAPPVIVHTDDSTEHFAVLLTRKLGHVLLADPSLGLHALPETRFQEQWTGYVLVPIVTGPTPWDRSPMFQTLQRRLQFLNTALQF